MTALEQPRFTFDEWSRIVSDPTKDKAYQQVTRLGGAVGSYLAWKGHEAAARTLDIYEGYLAALCVYLTTECGDPELEQVSAEMLLQAADRHPPRSYKVVRSAYRSFFEWCEDWRDLPRNPARKLPRSRRQPQRVYPVFSAVEQAQIVKAADLLPLPWVQRLRALCFLDLGIRKDEGRLLQVQDFDPVAKVVVVTGKGDKDRLVPFSDELWRALVTFRNRPIPAVRRRDDHGTYLEAREPVDTDYLFFPYGFNRASGQITWADPHRPLAPRSMHSWWADYIVKNSGVSYRSMHMARHTLGTNLSDAGEGLETIQDWLGHADPSTTKMYVHNSRARLQRGRGRLDEWRKAQGE